MQTTIPDVSADAVNLPWPSLPLAKMVSEVRYSVAVTNDANAAALGGNDLWRSSWSENFIMITLGTGVGSGIVINGQVVYGHDGLAGELGHMCVKRHTGRQCNCGRQGYLETYCSATGVARAARANSSRFAPSLLLFAILAPTPLHQKMYMMPQFKVMPWQRDFRLYRYYPR